MRTTMSKRRFLVAGAATLCAPWVLPARAAAPVKFVVPFAAGGSVDILARLLGRHITERTDQQVVVENKAGAGGNLAFSAVAQADPDGQTWLLASETFVVNPSFMQSVPYDPVKDFKPVMLIATLSQLLFAGASSSIVDLDTFIAAAKSNAKGLDIATQGNGSPGHFVSALMTQHGLNVVPVPHRGGGPAVQSVVSGTTAAGVTTLPAAIALVNEKTIRPIAVSTTKRSTFLPDLPTMNERLPGTIVDGWQAMFAPAGTQPEVVGRMNNVLASIIQKPEVRDILLKQCFEPVAGTPDGLGEIVRGDMERWRVIVEKTNIRAG